MEMVRKRDKKSETEREKKRETEMKMYRLEPDIRSETEMRQDRER